MLKFGAICLTVGLLCYAGGSLAADGPKNLAMPDFAPNAKTGWLLDHAAGVDDLLPPPNGGSGPVTFEKAHPYVPNGYGPQSTYRIADLSNPILQLWTIPSMKKANDEVLAGKVPFRARERCWPLGVPGFDAFSPVWPYFFLQTPEKIVVVATNGPEIRHIYLNASHSKDVKPSWYGESVGHYENGDTLVIDTIGISTKSYIDNYRTPHTEQLHVIERWKMASDQQAIEVSVFVEDPGAFTMPWRAVQRWRRIEDAPLSLLTCNENNGDFFHQGLVPLPEATKADF